MASFVYFFLNQKIYLLFPETEYMMLRCLFLYHYICNKSMTCFRYIVSVFVEVIFGDLSYITQRGIVIVQTQIYQ